MDKQNKTILKLVLGLLVILLLVAAIYFLVDSKLLKGSFRLVDFKTRPAIQQNVGGGATQDIGAAYGFGRPGGGGGF